MTYSVPAHQIAPLTKRFVAFFFDYALIAAYLVVLLAVGFGLTVLTGPLPIPSPWVTELIAFSTTVLPISLYFALQEGGAAQATWGKRRAGIWVTAVTNQPITYRQAFVRAIIKFAPWQLAHTSLIHIPGWPLAVETVGTVSMVGLVVAQGLVLLYILCLLLSPTRRTPYDWGAGTVVVAEN